MTALPALHKSEQGFVLVFALVMLILLTVLGVWATQTSVMDTRIATNERQYKEAFYHADSGLHLAERLLYVNAGCSREKGGFQNRKIGKLLAFPKGKEKDDVADFAEQLESDLDDDEKTVLDKKDHFVFLYFPNADMPSGLNVDELDGKTRAIRQAHTTVQTYYNPETAAGQGLLHDSGYEGVGVGAASGGQDRIYTIESRHRGGVGGKSKVIARWKLSAGILNSWGMGECEDKAPYAGW